MYHKILGQHEKMIFQTKMLQRVKDANSHFVFHKYVERFNSELEPKMLRARDGLTATVIWRASFAV